MRAKKKIKKILIINIFFCYNYNGGNMLISKIEKLKNNKYKIIIGDEKIVDFCMLIMI